MKNLMLILLTILSFSSCSKKEDVRTNSSYYPPPPPPPPPSNPCAASRPLVNATLIPVSSFSFGRCGMAVASAGNKIVFAGGWTPYATNHVDIYDISTNTWSVAVLSDNLHRVGVTVATLGKKIFFAGGDDGVSDFSSSAVDIYDASSDTWTTAQLSSGRSHIGAAALGNKVYFAGGFGYLGNYNYGASEVIDIYDNTTNTWSTASLSEARAGLSATTAGHKIYFAGGNKGTVSSDKIDIFDALTGTWSTSTLYYARTMMGSIATDNKIFWAGGVRQPGSLWTGTDHIEIRDLNTGFSTYSCVLPRWSFGVAKKNEYIVFFTGLPSNEPFSATQFDIFNTLTNEWSTGVLNIPVNFSNIISVNNTIYVAGGMNTSGGLYDKLWKLEF